MTWRANVSFSATPHPDVVESPTKAMRATPGDAFAHFGDRKPNDRPHINAHEPGLGIPPMAMAQIGLKVAHLHLARVLPHFQLVEHAIVEHQAGERFEADQTDERCGPNH